MKNLTKLKIFVYASLVAMVVLFLTIIFSLVFVSFRTSIANWKYIILAFFIIFVLVGFIFITGFTIIVRQERTEIKKSFDYYIEELISQSGVGLIIYSSSGIILWTSKFIVERFKGNLIGKSLQDISDEFKQNFLRNVLKFQFTSAGAIYEVSFATQNKTLTIIDVTNQEKAIEQYRNDKTVVGELEIDNFQRYQSSLPEEEIFQIQSEVIKILDKLVDRYKIIYRQYVNGKFILITKQDVFDVFMVSKFAFLEKINANTSLKGIRLTMSAGFGFQSSIPSELIQLAKEALSQSQSRGGDQVTIYSPSGSPIYFGATTESTANLSRVKIRQISNILAATLSSKNIKNVVLYGHKHADLDALGATYALAELAQHFGKKAFIQNQTFDNSTKKALSDYKHADIFIKPQKATSITNKNTVVIITDTSNLDLIENAEAINNTVSENVFIFDHHRASKISNQIDRTNVYIDPAASSSAEIVTEVLQFAAKNLKLSPVAAQFLLAGIYLDSKNFQRSTSFKTFEAAALLETFGAKSDEASNLLKFSEADSGLINKIISTIGEVKPGFYLAAYEGEVETDVIAMAADEILRTSGRVAAFVIAKVPNKKQYKMSARSNGVNVQSIAEQVGGGGHFGVAAALTEETLEVFKSNLIQAIVSVKNESNNN